MKTHHHSQRRNVTSSLLHLRHAYNFFLTLARTAWLPVLLILRGANLLVVLGQVLIRGAIRILFALLALLICSAMMFALLRTLWHPLMG